MCEMCAVARTIVWLHGCSSAKSGVGTVCGLSAQRTRHSGDSRFRISLITDALYGRPDRYFDRGPAPLRSPAPPTHAQSSQHVPPERSGPKAQRPMPRPPLSRLLSTTALWCVEAGGPVGRHLRSPAHPAPPRRCPIPSLVSHATRQAISKQAHAMAKAMADYQHARWVGASKIAML